MYVVAVRKSCFLLVLKFLPEPINTSGEQNNLDHYQINFLFPRLFLDLLSLREYVFDLITFFPVNDKL